MFPDGSASADAVAASNVRPKQKKDLETSADVLPPPVAGTKLASRWFSQPLFSQASEELAECLLREEFDPVVRSESFDPSKTVGTKDSGDDGIKEMEDSDLPQVPLSDKQKRQQKRRQEEIKKQSRKHTSAEDEGASDRPSP